MKVEFNYQLGTFYQLMLAKLKNYKTTLTTSYSAGMYCMDITTSSLNIAISTITSVATVATVTTGSAHGFSTGDSVIISNVIPSGYNGVYTITVTSTTVFTYTLSATLNNVAGDHAQYYLNPNGFVTVDGITLSVGLINYPLQLEVSQLNWEKRNIVPMQVAIPPQVYFPRRDDFGIWPIPRTLYTGTITYHYRDRNLSVDDYLTGTISLTKGSNILTGSGTAFTTAMVGRWFEVTDNTVGGQGYYYRITGYTSATVLTFNGVWPSLSVSGVSGYRIGESPEVPEDLHMYLPDGITGGYLKDIRKDMQNGQAYLNSFWTGDTNNPSRKEDDENVTGGLIGGMKAYADREDQRIITRNDDQINPYRYEPWAVKIS